MNALGAGSLAACKAAECLSRPSPQAAHVVQLAAYLTRAIANLQEAQRVVQQHG